MTNFEHVLKTIDPEYLKGILARSVAVDKETGKVYDCDTMHDMCAICIFNDNCSHGNGTEGTKEWFDQEYTGPETEEAVTSGGITW